MRLMLKTLSLSLALLLSRTSNFVSASNAHGYAKATAITLYAS